VTSLSETSKTYYGRTDSPCHHSCCPVHGIDSLSRYNVCEMSVLTRAKVAINPLIYSPVLAIKPDMQ